MTPQGANTTTDAARPLAPPAALGVLGAGQLGRMFVQAAQRMGFRAVVLSPTPDTPAAQVADDTVLGLTDDLDALQRFVARVDAVTVEFENVSSAALRWLARQGRPTRPGWRTVRVSQNRLREKTFLAGIGVPTAPWCPIRDDEELHAAPAALGWPLILKTAASGYDGKGQIKVDAATDLEPAWAALRRVPCVAEGLVTFAAEVSVVAARSEDGTTVTYPVCLNRHARHILDTTVCPAPVGPLVTAQAQALATRIASALGTVGVLTVEFFLTSGGDLLVNEMAPRPHNSGHLTIEAAVASQFDQQVRAMAGLPLASAALLQPAAMANLLGDLWRDGPPNWAAAMAADPGVQLHLYGKHSAAPGRKMGHLTVLDHDPDAALARVLAARHRLAPGVST